MDWAIFAAAIGIAAGIITICCAAIWIDRRLFRAREESKDNVAIQAAKGSVVNVVNAGMINLVSYQDGWPTTDEPRKKQAFETARGYMNNGEYTLAARSFEACFGLATTASERSSLHNYIATCFLIQGRLEIAVGHCLEAQMAAREAGDLEALAAASVNLALLRFVSRDPEAARYFDEALPLARQAGHKEAEVLALLGGVLCQLATGVDDKQSRAAVLRTVQDALRVAEAENDETGQASLLAVMALLHLVEGQPPQAMEFSSNALCVARQTGDRLLLANVLLYHGIASLLSRPPDEALPVLQEGLTTAKEIGYRLGEAIYLSLLGDARERMGQPREALELAQQAKQIFHEVGADAFEEVASRDVQRLSKKEA